MADADSDESSTGPVEVASVEIDENVSAETLAAFRDVAERHEIAEAVRAYTDTYRDLLTEKKTSENLVGDAELLRKRIEGACAEIERECAAVSKDGLMGKYLDEKLGPARKVTAEFPSDFLGEKLRKAYEDHYEVLRTADFPWMEPGDASGAVCYELTHKVHLWLNESESRATDATSVNSEDEVETMQRPALTWDSESALSLLQWYLQVDEWIKCQDDIDEGKAVPYPPVQAHDAAVVSENAKKTRTRISYQQKRLWLDTFVITCTQLLISKLCEFYDKYGIRIYPVEKTCSVDDVLNFAGEDTDDLAFLKDEQARLGDLYEALLEVALGLPPSGHVSEAARLLSTCQNLWEDRGVNGSFRRDITGRVESAIAFTKGIFSDDNIKNVLHTPELLKLIVTRCLERGAADGDCLTYSESHGKQRQQHSALYGTSSMDAIDASSLDSHMQHECQEAEALVRKKSAPEATMGVVEHVREFSSANHDNDVSAQDVQWYVGIADGYLRLAKEAYQKRVERCVAVLQMETELQNCHESIWPRVVGEFANAEVLPGKDCGLYWNELARVAQATQRMCDRADLTPEQLAPLSVGNEIVDALVRFFTERPTAGSHDDSYDASQNHLWLFSATLNVLAVFWYVELTDDSGRCGKLQDFRGKVQELCRRNGVGSIHQRFTCAVHSNDYPGINCVAAAIELSDSIRTCTAALDEVIGADVRDAVLRIGNSLHPKLEKRLDDLKERVNPYNQWIEDTGHQSEVVHLSDARKGTPVFKVRVGDASNDRFTAYGSFCKYVEQFPPEKWVFKAWDFVRCTTRAQIEHCQGNPSTKVEQVRSELAAIVDAACRTAVTPSARPEEYTEKRERTLQYWAAMMDHMVFRRVKDEGEARATTMQKYVQHAMRLCVSLPHASLDYAEVDGGVARARREARRGLIEFVEYGDPAKSCEYYFNSETIALMLWGVAAAFWDFEEVQKATARLLQDPDARIARDRAALVEARVSALSTVAREYQSRMKAAAEHVRSEFKRCRGRESFLLGTVPDLQRRRAAFTDEMTQVNRMGGKLTPEPSIQSRMDKLGPVFDSLYACLQDAYVQWVLMVPYSSNLEDLLYEWVRCCPGVVELSEGEFKKRIDDDVRYGNTATITANSEKRFDEYMRT